MSPSSRRALAISLPVQDELAIPAYLALGQAAEAAGYDWLFLGEIAGPEAFAMLGALAGTTERIGLATGILSTFTRSPALLGMGFATLAALAPGRVMAALGTSSRLIAEDWHDRHFRSPLRQARETVEAMRGVLTGERTTLEGEQVRLRDFRLMPATAQPVPILLGAIQPKMLRLAGAIADGVYLAFCPDDEVARRVALMREGAAEAGRDPDELVVALTLSAYAGPETRAARDRMAEFVIRYVSLPTHRQGFEAHLAALDPVLKLWDAGERSEAIAAVPEEAIEAVCSVGDGRHVADRVARYWDAGVDLLVVHALGVRRGDAAGPAATITSVAEATGRGARAAAAS